MKTFRLLCGIAALDYLPSLGTDTDIGLLPETGLSFTPRSAN